MDFDPAVVTLTFEADDLNDLPTNSLPAAIPVVDDIINEAPEQLFAAVLQVVSAAYPDRVQNSERNLSTCIIEDNDGEWLCSYIGAR